MEQEKSPSSALILTILTLLYLALVVVDLRRHLWLDELLTYHLALLPTIPQMFHAALRFDLNPPLFHLLARLGLWLAHGNPVGVRLPSIIEFYGAGICLFFYARRRLGPWFGALPVLLLWYGPMSIYATEARPYAAVCFWFCALLLLWETAIHRTDRKWLLAAIALCSLGLLASHVFGTLTIFAFVCAEAVRFWRTRRADWSLWIALFGPLLFTAFYIPLFASYGRAPDFPKEFEASPRKLAGFYWNNFTGVALCAVAMLAAAFLALRTEAARRRREDEPTPHLSVEELALFVAQALIPFALTLIFMLQHGAFWGRYCITSILSLYVLAAFVLAWFIRKNRLAGTSAFWAGAFLVLVHNFAWPLWLQETRPAPQNAAVLEQVDPNLPLAAASGLTFVELGQYEGPKLLNRLYYPQDEAAAIRIAHATMFNDLAHLQQVFDLPGHVVPYAQFVHEHPHFVVLATPDYPEDWLLRKLHEDGASVRPIGKYNIPYKDTELFEVWLR